MNIVGGGFQQVMLFSRPIWEGVTRVVVDGDLISVEVRNGEGRFSQIWCSDSPLVVQAPRPHEEAIDGTTDKQQPA